MLITKFWARGYRSLRDVTLDPLGPFNVFYGSNGAGKSNLLDALHALFGVMPIAVDTAFDAEPDARLSFREGGERATGWLRDEDFDVRATDATIELGAVITDPTEKFGGLLYRAGSVTQVEIEIQLRRLRPGEYGLKFSRLRIDGRQPGLPFSDPTVRDILQRIVPNAFAHLGVTRTLAVRGGSTGTPDSVRRAIGTIPDGEIVHELFRAKNARDRQTRERYETLRRFMSSALQRGVCDVFVDPVSQQPELREMLPEPNPNGLDIPLERAGYGVVQLYAIVAAILLSRGRLAAIEEPEAHLHAPTTGRRLRALLSQLVAEGQVDQLFIATHSNLFDLDPSGYWDVSLDPETGTTTVQRARLSDIDARHLYEPGPAKHALAQLLRYAPVDEVVSRGPAGEPITAGEMLASLQADDDRAMDFLRSVHGAALRIVRLESRPKADAT
jgi:predicted ATPase